MSKRSPKSVEEKCDIVQLLIKGERSVSQLLNSIGLLEPLSNDGETSTSSMELMGSKKVTLGNRTLMS